MYQRILGKDEILGGHRWVEAQESKCDLCNKSTYCLVIWNKHLSRTQDHDFYYHHSSREPIIYNKHTYKQPVLCSKDKIHKMIPVHEFYERVLMRFARSSHVRYCNNEMENEKSELLQGLI